MFELLIWVALLKTAAHVPRVGPWVYISKKKNIVLQIIVLSVLFYLGGYWKDLYERCSSLFAFLRTPQDRKTVGIAFKNICKTNEKLTATWGKRLWSRHKMSLLKPGGK